MKKKSEKKINPDALKTELQTQALMAAKRNLDSNDMLAAQTAIHIYEMLQS